MESNILRHVSNIFSVIVESMYWEIFEARRQADMVQLAMRLFVVLVVLHLKK